MTSVLIRDTQRRGNVTRKAENGVMWPQPSNAGSFQKLEEARRDISLENTALPPVDFRLLACRTVRK